MLALRNYAQLKPQDFEFFRRWIQDKAGLVYSESKRDLVQFRLLSRVQELGFQSFSEYRGYLESLPPNNPEWQEFTNLLTTNKTDWFRENEHFEYIIREFLPAWKKLGKKKLFAWSVACSTGEEPYTLAMVLDRHLGLTHDFHILATDLDTNVLDTAKNGVYRKSRILEQVPPDFQKSAFASGSGELADWYKIRNRLRAKVQFDQCNLTHTPYQWGASFDLILCRNVLIYFSPQTIEKVAQHLSQVATSKGTLIIGHSETIPAKEGQWSYVQPTIYTREKRP